MYLANIIADLGITCICIFQIDLSISFSTSNLYLQEALFCYTFLYS